jgi:hypothetical protein
VASHSRSRAILLCLLVYCVSNVRPRLLAWVFRTGDRAREGFGEPEDVLKNPLFARVDLGTVQSRVTRMSSQTATRGIES